MEEEEFERKMNLERNKILAILPSYQKLQEHIYLVELYSSDIKGKEWLYCGLKGFLTLIIDNNLKTKYICLYNPFTYQKCFQYELYNNFEEFFYNLAPKFRCFEIDSGFIGLKFEKEKDAIIFEKLIKKITSIEIELLYKETTITEDQKLEKGIVLKYTEILKIQFFEENINLSEDVIQLNRFRNFRVLDGISFDRYENKFRFKLYEILDELKQMFLFFGIKKKDLILDIDYSFNLFKKIILGLGSEKNLKYLTIEDIEHNFLPPADRKKLRRIEQEIEANLNSTLNYKKTKKEKKKPVSKRLYKTPCLQLPPPPPPPPPPVPNDIGKVFGMPKPSINIERDKEENDQKEKNGPPALCSPKPEEDNNKNNMEDDVKNFLQNALFKAIINKRKKNFLIYNEEEEEEEEEEDEWGRYMPKRIKYYIL